ncbi:methyltransferase domain-containing protein [Streptomyces sp. ET3-23]|uniref:SAM-dependent methyltransferase n=1 Tax=Streptomyces sp. ET3-23 TaxID=2885643 RepID=UPI001D0F7A69|nr:methyltransferase domain-containing protein [Streptomyces sp. ET3-23]MCC2280932.1 methyltransferase domain-containing protein [Streptomyces sp. ET3-23]
MPALHESKLARNEFEAAAQRYYDTKCNDELNLGLGHMDGFYHHHFAVGDFERAVLNLSGAERQMAIKREIHRLETSQVDTLIEALTLASPPQRILDAGSGRGGTAFLLHQAFDCPIDGVNFSRYQNRFAREQAVNRGMEDVVRFHDRNMIATGFPDETFDFVITNETTMYVDLKEAFSEFARLLRPGGRYVLLTWCINNAVVAAPAEAALIDEHYHCHTHTRSAYLAALLGTGLTPYLVDDFTASATPYWELRAQSHLATGVERAYLEGYRSDHVNYIRIAARKAGPERSR